jgi:co-chaperonin GroES (HSP10)
MIDFKVPRAKDCIIIDTKKWLQNNSQNLTIHRMSGRDIPTFIAQVVEENVEKECLKGAVNKGDTVLLSRVVSEVAQCRPFEIDSGDKRFYNVPIMQVLGVFEEGRISLNTFTLLFDKILLKKVDSSRVGGLEIPNSNSMIGEVIKVGSCSFDKDWNCQELKVKVGDKVLVRDNATTQVYFENDLYYVTEESMVVGIFNTEVFELDNLQVINNSILTEPYIPKKVLSSDLLTPLLNFENEDVTDIYNRDLFKIVAVDKSLTNLKENDIVLIDRSVTTYVYLGINKYYTLIGTDYLEAKII